jgi:hypothetical protein
VTRTTTNKYNEMKTLHDNAPAQTETYSRTKGASKLASITGTFGITATRATTQLLEGIKVTGATGYTRWTWDGYQGLEPSERWRTFGGP